jgi:hypothetical protein
MLIAGRVQIGDVHFRNIPDNPVRVPVIHPYFRVKIAEQGKRQINVAGYPA